MAANVNISSSVHSTSSVKIDHLACSYSWLILTSSTYNVINKNYHWLAIANQSNPHVEMLKNISPHSQVFHENKQTNKQSGCSALSGNSLKIIWFP